MCTSSFFSPYFLALYATIFGAYFLSLHATFFGAHCRAMFSSLHLAMFGDRTMLQNPASIVRRITLIYPVFVIPVTSVLHYVKSDQPYGENLRLSEKPGAVVR